MQARSARWYGVITLLVIVAISFIDRMNIALMVTDAHFLQHFGMAAGDRASQAALSTAFMVGYGLSAFVLTPFCAALLGVRRSLLLGLILWGGVTFVSPAFDSYALLLLSRVLLGVSEGPLFGLASSYIKAYFEGHENGKPNSLVNMGTGLGLAIGMPLISSLIATLDWQGAFHVLGLINLLIGLPLVLAYIHMPQLAVYQQRPASVREMAARVRQIFSGALQTRYLLMITVLTAAYLAYLWGSVSWLPTYLKEARGFALREMGWLGSLPQYAMIIGVLISGFVIDRIPRRQVPLIFVVGSICVAIAVLTALNVSNNYMAVLSLIVAGIFCGIQTPPLPSTVQYYAQPQNVASAMSITNGTGALVSAFMPLLMGKVMMLASAGGASPYASLSAGFAVLIGTQLLILVCGWMLWLRERAQLPDSATSPLQPRDCRR
ncbi:MAG: MFS transporter [Stenotrophomonas sp.]